MKLSIIISSSDAETNWNAFRLANLALKKGDVVSIFLLGEGVEYAKSSSEKFDIKSQIEDFLQSPNAKIISCGTCLRLRQQEAAESCPAGNLEDFYSLISGGDKILTF